MADPLHRPDPNGDTAVKAGRGLPTGTRGTRLCGRRRSGVAPVHARVVRAVLFHVGNQLFEGLGLGHAKAPLFCCETMSIWIRERMSTRGARTAAALHPLLLLEEKEGGGDAAD